MGVVMITIIACDSSDDSTPLDIGKDYIPLKKGWFQIYDVNEIIYNLGEPETLAYELKTIVVDSFANAEENYTYVIYRSKRVEDGDWQYIDTWSIRVSNKEAVVQEENIPFVALRFPVQEGIQWNGNEYNTVLNPVDGEPEDLYRLDNVGGSYTVESTSFDDCITVNQEDNQEFIVYFDKRAEIYARNVGLIYKEKTQLHYCTDTEQGCIGQQIVEEGVIYKQSIKSYGVE